jgi:hypothetical protein
MNLYDHDRNLWFLIFKCIEGNIDRIVEANLK